MYTYAPQGLIKAEISEHIWSGTGAQVSVLPCQLAAAGVFKRDFQNGKRNETGTCIQGKNLSCTLKLI